MATPVPDPLAPIWDSLGFRAGPSNPAYRPAPPATVPLPSANPLRTGPTTQPAGGFSTLLEALFKSPFDFSRADQIRRERNDADARAYYNAPEGDVPLPQRGARAQPPVPAAPPAETENEEEGDPAGVPPLPERAPGEEAPRAAARGPGGDIRVPVGQVPSPAIIDPFRAAMLQIGLNLMTPSWGNGLSQIGQAVGGGVAAAGRAQQINEDETDKAQKKGEASEDRDLKRRKVEADIEHTEAQTEDIKSGESSRSRRLKGRQPTVLDEAAAAAGLGPKGKAFLAQRLKTLNQDDLLGNDDSDPVTKFNEIIEQAKKLDAPSAPAKAPNTGTDTVQAVDTSTLPLYNTPADVKKAIADKALKKGDSFRFIQDGKEAIGKVP